MASPFSLNTQDSAFSECKQIFSNVIIQAFISPNKKKVRANRQTQSLAHKYQIKTAFCKQPKQMASDGAATIEVPSLSISGPMSVCHPPLAPFAEATGT